MDKFETPSRKILVSLEREDLSDVADERSQLVFQKGDEKTYLNSQKTYITSLQFEYPTNAKTVSSERLQDVRALQPMVRVKVASRYQRPVEDDERTYSFLDNPRVSYEGAFALRNYSFSNLR
jgi:hypothetical protein